MAIAIRTERFEAAAPDGAVVGVIGENGSGKGRLLRAAAATASARYIGPADRVEIPAGGLLLIEHALARLDAVERELAAMALHAFRRAGGTALVVSHDEDLLRRVCDEIWWVRDGALAARGDPGEVLACYQKHIADRVRPWGETASQSLSPGMRRGDGRAEVLAVETIGEGGRPTMVWRSGELVVVKVRVLFRDAVAEPVVGIMIRTRIGLNVYGTNTELERLKFGPCAAGQTIELGYAFRC